MKQIKIDGNEYSVECNAFCYVQHKKTFNVGIFDDLQALKSYLVVQSLKSQEIKEKNPNATEEEINVKVSDYMGKFVSEFIEALTRITYTMIASCQSIGSYEEWMKSIKNLNLGESWIVEVTELAVSSFC